MKSKQITSIKKRKYKWKKGSKQSPTSYFKGPKRRSGPARTRFPNPDNFSRWRRLGEKQKTERFRERKLSGRIPRDTHTTVKVFDSSNQRRGWFAQKMNGGPSGFSTFFCVFSCFLGFKDRFFFFLFGNENLTVIFYLTDNAPVTRTIVIASALFTIIFGIQGRSRNLGWSYQVLFFSL